MFSHNIKNPPCFSKSCCNKMDIREGVLRLFHMFQQNPFQAGEPQYNIKEKPRCFPGAFKHFATLSALHKIITFQVLLYSEDFACFLIPPVSPLLQRPVEPDRSRIRAVVNTAAAVPALVRMQDYRRLASLRIGNKNIYLAHFHAFIAALADIGVKNNGRIGRNNIGQGIFIFFIHNKASLFCPADTLIVFIMGFVIFHRVAAKVEGQFSGFNFTVLQFNCNKLFPLLRVSFGVIYSPEIQ